MTTPTARSSASIEAVARHHRRDVAAPERERRAVHAEARVVVAVDHRVLGVVGEGIEDVRREQQPAFERQALVDRRRRPSGCRSRRRRRGRPAAAGRSAWRTDSSRRWRAPTNDSRIAMPVQEEHQRERREQRATRASASASRGSISPRGERPVARALDVPSKLRSAKSLIAQPAERMSDRADHEDARARRAAAGRARRATAPTASATAAAARRSACRAASAARRRSMRLDDERAIHGR